MGPARKPQNTAKPRNGSAATVTTRRRLAKPRPVLRQIPVSAAAAIPVRDLEPPFDMSPVRAPTFPDRVIDIRGNGATENQDCTQAIARAIEACADAGGGRVLVPPGEWLTGAIHLKSNIDLHVSKGATVRFSSDPEQYLPPVFVRWGGQECFNFSPFIYASGCDNIAVTGSGVLLGQGKSWWAWEKREVKTRKQLYQMVLDGVAAADRRFGCEDMPLRPPMICPINCTNVLLEDFTVGEGGPQWTIHVAYSEGVLVRRVRVIAPAGPSNDGIILDSSRNVIVEDCDLHTAEDCVALKSGMNEDGRRVGRPTENVIIRRIRATHGRGGFAIGSDMSGGVRNVFIHDCHFDGPTAGIRIKAARGRGGVVEDVFVQDITMGRIPGAAIELATDYPSYISPHGQPPTFRNIRISNLTCSDCKTAVRMEGLADNVLRGITLENLKVNCDQGLLCAAASGVHLKNVSIVPKIGPVLSLKDSQEVLIDGLYNANAAGVFLDLRGRTTKNIRLCGNGEAKTGTPRPSVVLGVDVPRDALVHE
jgi:polygalacturonase